MSITTMKFTLNFADHIIVQDVSLQSHIIVQDVMDISLRSCLRRLIIILDAIFTSSSITTITIMVMGTFARGQMY
jgi:hypothetical protein